MEKVESNVVHAKIFYEEKDKPKIIALKMTLYLPMEIVKWTLGSIIQRSPKIAVAHIFAA